MVLGLNYCMTNNSNRSFLHLLMGFSASVYLLSGCQQENKPVLINQPNILNNVKSKNQDAKASPEAATEKQRVVKKSFAKIGISKLFLIS